MKTKCSTGAIFGIVVTVLFGFLAISSIPSLLFGLRRKETEYSQETEGAVTISIAHEKYPTDASFERIEVEGFGPVDFVWTAPSPERTIQGISFLAHSCKQPPLKWYQRSPRCPRCFGRPAEKELAGILHRNGYVTFATYPASGKGENRCYLEKDVKAVDAVLRHLQARLKLSEKSSLPRIGVGVGNGVKFLVLWSQLSKQLPNGLNGIVAINGGVWAGLQDESEQQQHKRPLPPLFLIDMSRNFLLAMFNEATVKKLNLQGRLVQHRSCDPRPLSPAYFHQIGEYLSVEDSKRLYAALSRREEQLVWPGSGVLVDDPLLRSTGWKNVSVNALPHIYPHVDNFEQRAVSGLVQLLNLAWGLNEVTEEYFEEGLEWVNAVAISQLLNRSNV